jgi:hypothetical protein
MHNRIYSRNGLYFRRRAIPAAGRDPVLPADRRPLAADAQRRRGRDRPPHPIAGLILQPDFVTPMVGGLAAGSDRFWRGASGAAARWTITAGAGRLYRVDDQQAEQRGDFVAGDRDLIFSWRGGALGGGGDGEESQGEQGQGGPPLPGVPAADLVLIQPGQALAGLEIFLRGPPDPGDLDQGGQRDGAGAAAAVERQFPGAAVAADQQPTVTRPARVDGQPGPVVSSGGGRLTSTAATSHDHEVSLEH